MRVGVFGAGQLGRMLALAAAPLGVRCEFYDEVEGCAGDVGPTTVASWSDQDSIRAFAARCDVLTFEFENVPRAVLETARLETPVFPGPDAIAAASDRIVEKETFSASGLPAARYRAIDTAADIDSLGAIETVPFPIILKTRRGGYDGKGQRVVGDQDEARAAFDELGKVPLIAEEKIAFDREVSIAMVRSRSGDVCFYPPSENVHVNGILATTIAPASGLDDSHIAAAQSAMRALSGALDYVGVLVVEFFVTAGGLIANEMATRVHNSYHWTIDGAATSQFENHMRAVLDWPLGPVDTRPCGMLNLVGTAPGPATIAPRAGASWHLYRKAPRAGRKIGHVTVVQDDPTARDQAMAELRRLLHDSVPGVD